MLIGNYGEAIVAARLSPMCLVRPAAAGTDVGIDFYCETVDEEFPNLHFWMQVKAGGQCKPALSGQEAAFTFEGSHLDYWSRQPVPVFAALVPTGWPPLGEPDVFIVDVSSQLIAGGATKHEDTRLKSSERWGAGDSGSVRKFLEKSVPAAAAKLAVRMGVVGRIPEARQQFVHSYPVVPITRWKKQIENQIRVTAADSVLFSVLFEGEHDVSFLERMSRVVSAFAVDDHWENLAALGILQHVRGNYPEAIRLYGEVDKCFSRDPRTIEWRDKKPEFLPELLRAARASEPPPRFPSGW